MPNYHPYPEYKDSGIDWLGKIPTHWQTLKIKYIADLKSGDSLTSEAISDDAEYPVYGGNGFRGYTTKYTHEGVHPLIGRQGALCGNINYANGKFWASEHAVIVTPLKEANPFWLGELLRSMNLGQYSISAAQPGLAVDNIKNLAIPHPSITEQNQIAAFLNRETAKIDQLIAKQQQLIELLKEKRQAVISHAVTKGLNPNVKMKPSGVEWLGDVPEHWEIKRIGLLFSESSSRADSDEEQDFPILRVSIHHGISDKELTEEESDRKLQRSDDKSLYKVVHENYLVYNMMRAWQGGFGAAKISGLVSPAYVICKPKTSIDSSFFELILRTANAITELKRYSKGITDFRLRLYWDEFKDICVPVPPVSEVQLIIKSIEKISDQYNHLIGKAEEQIELLRERRAALISAAVTGKIDVREVALLA